jgi:adenylate kinase/tetratricopeptide (TPR) repeat protein
MNHGVLVVCGDPGVGKTTVVRSALPGAEVIDVRMHATSRTDLIHAIAARANLQSSGTPDEEDDILEKLSSKLGGRALVLDNFDDPHETLQLIRRLTACVPRVVVVTRSPSLASDLSLPSVCVPRIPTGQIVRLLDLLSPNRSACDRNEVAEVARGNPAVLKLLSIRLNASPSLNVAQFCMEIKAAAAAADDDETAVWSRLVASVLEIFSKRERDMLFLLAASSPAVRIRRFEDIQSLTWDVRRAGQAEPLRLPGEKAPRSLTDAISALASLVLVVKQRSGALVMHPKLREVLRAQPEFKDYAKEHAEAVLAAVLGGRTRHSHTLVQPESEHLALAEARVDAKRLAEWHDEILQAVGACLKHDLIKSAVPLCLVAERHWRDSGPFDQAKKYLQKVASHPDCSEPDMLHLHYGLVWILDRFGDNNGMRGIIDHGIGVLEKNRLWKTPNADLLRGRFFEAKGVSLRRDKDPEAIDWMKKAEAAFVKAKAPARDLAYNAVEIAFALVFCTQDETLRYEASSWFSKANEHARALRDNMLDLAHYLNCAGRYCQATKNTIDALERYNQAATIYEQLDLRVPRIRLLLRIAGIYIDSGNVSKANGFIKAARTIARGASCVKVTQEIKYTEARASGPIW